MPYSKINIKHKYQQWRIRPHTYRHKAVVNLSNNESSLKSKRQWEYFFKKQIDNCPEILQIKSEINDIREEYGKLAAELFDKESSLIEKLKIKNKEIQVEWENTPEKIEELKKKHKTEKALKILKRSVKK